RLEIVKYAFATVLVSVLPTLFGETGLLYGAVALASGLWYLSLTVKLRRMPVDRKMDQYARRVFGHSITYLFVLYAALIADHLLAMSGLL
ncbi:hypothetical protein BW247_06795, partial [Acidihalobacter ferrooxydans]